MDDPCNEVTLSSDTAPRGTCQNCTRPITQAVRDGRGFEWAHDDTDLVGCKPTISHHRPWDVQTAQPDPAKVREAGCTCPDDAVFRHLPGCALQQSPLHAREQHATTTEHALQNRIETVEREHDELRADRDRWARKCELARAQAEQNLAQYHRAVGIEQETVRLDAVERHCNETKEARRALKQSSLPPTSGKLCGYKWSAFCFTGAPEIELELGTDGWNGCGHSDLTIEQVDLDEMVAAMAEAHRQWAVR